MLRLRWLFMEARFAAAADVGRGQGGSRWLPRSGCTVWRSTVGQGAAVWGTAVIGPPGHGLRGLTDHFLITWSGDFDPCWLSRDPNRIGHWVKEDGGFCGLLKPVAATGFSV